MVYGEYIQDAAVPYQLLANSPPAPLETAILVNSGTEPFDRSIENWQKVIQEEQILAQECFTWKYWGSLEALWAMKAQQCLLDLLIRNRIYSFFNWRGYIKNTEENCCRSLETFKGVPVL